MSPCTSVRTSSHRYTVTKSHPPINPRPPEPAQEYSTAQTGMKKIESKAKPSPAQPSPTSRAPDLQLHLQTKIHIHLTQPKPSSAIHPIDSCPPPPAAGNSHPQRFSASPCRCVRVAWPTPTMTDSLNPGQAHTHQPRQTQSRHPPSRKGGKTLPLLHPSVRNRRPLGTAAYQTRSVAGRIPGACRDARGGRAGGQGI